VTAPPSDVEAIAHAFDNVLTCLLGQLALAQERIDPPGDARLRHHLERARAEAQRGAALVRRLRAAGSNEQPVPATACYNPRTSERQAGGEGWASSGSASAASTTGWPGRPAA
jgi:hypothetical protein